MSTRKGVAVFVGLLILLGCTQALLDKQASQGELVNAPSFEVDPLWPKPLPNHWLLGMTIGGSTSRTMSGSSTAARRP